MKQRTALSIFLLAFSGLIALLFYLKDHKQKPLYESKPAYEYLKVPACNGDSIMVPLDGKTHHLRSSGISQWILDDSICFACINGEWRIIPPRYIHRGDTTFIIGSRPEDSIRLELYLDSMRKIAPGDSTVGELGDGRTIGGSVNYIIRDSIWNDSIHPTNIAPDSLRLIIVSPSPLERPPHHKRHPPIDYYDTARPPEWNYDTSIHIATTPLKNIDNE